MRDIAANSTGVDPKEGEYAMKHIPKRRSDVE